MRVRRALQRLARGDEPALRSIDVRVLAEQMSKTEQRAGGDAVAGRCRFVGEGFRPMDERLVIVRGEEESAVFAVLEMRKQRVGKRTGEVEILAAPAVLQQ